MIASDQKIFLRLKHTILLNILLVNVLLLVTLVIYSRSWRFIATREPETWKSHKLCERAEILVVLRRKHIILLNQSIISCW